MEIRERIIAKMKELGMKQVDLVRATGASKGTVSLWVKGDTVPSGENLVRLAQALGVTPEWLQFGKETRTSGNNVVSLYGGELPAPNGEHQPMPFGLSKEEQDIIRMFRLMTEEQKKETIQDAQDTVEANERMLEQLLAIKRA